MGHDGSPGQTFGGLENADLADNVLSAAESVVGQVRHNVLTTGTGHGIEFDWTGSTSTEED